MELGNISFSTNDCAFIVSWGVLIFSSLKNQVNPETLLNKVADETKQTAAIAEFLNKPE